MQNKKRIPIEDVLNKAEILFHKEGIEAFSLKNAFVHWGYSAESVEAQALVQGLVDYRFVTVSSEGANKTVQLTDLAIRFVGDKWSVTHSDKSGGDLSGMWSEMSQFFQ